MGWLDPAPVGPCAMMLEHQDSALVCVCVCIRRTPWWHQPLFAHEKCLHIYKLIYDGEFYTQTSKDDDDGGVD